ncbi:hypothetical protein RHS04_08598 [Rhizoctonia solani]|uniref:DUF6532 domain-containing protein n=1 Tax=Rhizoctonia solani TaxID=456999 RepID=A0A8H7H2R5_9AGAM|nr:hypothetical protein RHS04_08598 [Rhizoctonia solani]
MPPRTRSASRSAHQLVEAHPVNLHANSDAETQKLYNTVRADVSSQTKPAQGAKQHERELQNPLKVNKSAVGATCAPDLATEASRLIRRGQCNPASDAGVRERPALSRPPPNLVVPTPSPKNLSKRDNPGPQDWVGNVGGPAVSGRSLCHQVPQKLSLNGRLGDKPQPACTLETLNHKGLLRYAQEEFNINGSGWNTQTIIRHLRLAQAQQALRMGSLWRPSLIDMFPARPIKVGGGWTQNVIRRLPVSSSNRKRTSDQLDPAESSKRQRLSIPAEDTANEMEEHSPATGNNVWSRIAAERIVQACGTSASEIAWSTWPPQWGIVAPPPSRQSTPSTIIEVASPRLPSPERVTDLPSSPSVVETGSENNISGTSNHNEDLGSTEEPPNPTEPGSESRAPTACQHGRNKSLCPADLNTREDPSNALQQRLYRRPIIAAPTTPLVTRTQLRPPPKKNITTHGQRAGGSRRLDPVSAARANMLKFNKAVAQGKAPSLIKSVRRESQGATQCGSPTSRPPDGLLEDNEEDLAQAKARAKSRNLIEHLLPRSRCCVYKQKPLARDFSGLERQVLIMAKVHLFGYSLVQGIYQTQATFFQWASAVHHATWQMELPDRPYKRPPDAIFEIMVNNIATLQGKTKERLRKFVESVCGFEQSLTNQNIIRKNLGIFNKIYPNTFHCKNWDSREGDYKNPNIGRCVALAFFHSPGSVGVMYPDYFQEMPITIVAFALAIWLYCIEEWENGWRQNGNLGMAAMREKYEAQLAGLKELRKVAPRRLRQLQMEWRDYVAEYSGALFVPESDSNAGSCSTRIRPDTPKPEDCDAISTDEMETHLFENARQASNQEQMDLISAQEMVDGNIDIDINADPHSSCCPSPILEYNKHGILTAYSKGKGRTE